MTSSSNPPESGLPPPSTPDGLPANVAQREEFFRSVADAVSSHVWINAPDGVPIHINASWKNYTGLTFEQTQQGGWRDSMHPDDVGEIERLRKEGMRTGREYSFEYRVRRKDGVYRWHVARVVPTRDAQGAVIAWVGAGTDIEDIKSAEVLLRESEERFRLACEGSGTGAWEWDIVNDRVRWSDRVYEIYGLKHGEFSGRVADFGALTHPEDSPRVMKAIEDALAGRAPYRVELRAINRRGRHRWIYSAGEVYRDKSGKPQRMLGVVSDITDRKETEQRLVHQAEALWQSNRELEQFAYVSSHDLKEPLRKIASYVDLLRSKDAATLSADGTHYLEGITDGVMRMRSLIDDLLSFSRLSQQTAVEDNVDMNGVVADALSDLGPAIQEAGATVNVGDLPSMKGSGTQMRQLFQNLIGNAIKFRGEKKPVIDILSGREDNEWTLTVRDNGIGIDPQYFGQIFRVFQSLHPRHRYPGTGIGLAVCKKIVERRGGTISVASAPGQGAAFTVRFPVEPPEKPPV